MWFSVISKGNGLLEFLDDISSLIQETSSFLGSSRHLTSGGLCHLRVVSHMRVLGSFGRRRGH